MKASVIIPVYNGEEYLEETLKSALNQNFDDFEVIVVDDGSTDRTFEIANNFKASMALLRIIRQKNSGVSTARNRGMNDSKGEFIFFLDADDVWDENNIKWKIEYLESHPNVGLVHSDAELINSNSESLGNFYKGKEGRLSTDLLSWNGVCIPGPSSICIRREVAFKVGGFDQSLSTSADKDFFIRISLHYDIGRIPEVTWRYRIHKASMHLNLEVMEKDELYIQKKAIQFGWFHSKNFERECRVRTRFIMARSWIKHHRNFSRAFKNLIIALRVSPYYFLVSTIR